MTDKDQQNITNNAPNQGAQGVFHLLRAIRAWITPDDLAARRARETLHRAVANWREHGWLLDSAALRFITEQRDSLSNLSTEELDFLLRAAVAHQLDIDIWAPAAHLMGLDIWPHLQPLLNADRVRRSLPNHQC